MVTRQIASRVRSEVGNRGPVTIRLNFASPRMLHPMAFLAVGLGLAILPALLSTDEQRARWVGPWRVSVEHYFLLLGAGACIAGGIAFALVRPQGRRRSDDGPREFKIDTPTLRRATSVLVVLYVVGYLAWSISALAHGLTIDLALDTLRGVPGANYRARETLVTIPGLSTLTEIGPILVAALVASWRAGDRRPILLAIILAVSVLRVFLNSERLSLIAIAVPVLIVALVTRRHGTDVPSRRGARALSYWLAPVFLVLLFLITERGRSWNAHYRGEFGGGLLQFSLDRLWSYYATATNNGVVYDQFMVPRLEFPDLTLQALTNAPIVGDLLSAIGWYSPSDGHWLDVLRQYANPELNNPGAILPVIGEVGLVLGGVLFVIWGWFIGRLYYSTRQGSVVGLCGYAAMVIGLLELARFPYFTSGRMVPGLVGLAVLNIMLKEDWQGKGNEP